MLCVCGAENSENGGLVIMMSDSSRNFFTSTLLKSPSPSIYDHCKSFISILPSLFSSAVRVKIFPFIRVLFRFWLFLLPKDFGLPFYSVYRISGYCQSVMLFLDLCTKLRYHKDVKRVLDFVSIITRQF